MGRKRKTFDIVQLILTVNLRNAASTCSAEVRAGWNSLLESVLHAAGLYVGFNYLGSEHLTGSAEFEEPGIRFVKVFGDSPGPCDTVVSAGEFFDALAAENRGRGAGGLPSLHCPTGYARLFPDESRRTYHVHRTLHAEYQKLHEVDKGNALRRRRRSASE